MRNSVRTALLFAAASLLASLPIAWFLRDFYVPYTPFGRFLWIAMPALALALSGLTSFAVARSTAFPGMGFWRGALVALLVLVICAALAAPYAALALVPAAVLFVGWFAVPLGGLFGWLLGRNARLRPNNSFKPKPLRGSA